MGKEIEQQRSLKTLRGNPIFGLEAALQKARCAAGLSDRQAYQPIKPKGGPANIKPPLTKKTLVAAESLEEDVHLYPDLESTLRKIYNHGRLNDSELDAMVRLFRSAPERHPRLFDNIQDALNPLISKALGQFTGTQESLHYHVGVKHLDRTMPGRDDADEKLSVFLMDKENKAARHPNLGKATLFFLIPQAVRRVVLGYPLEGQASFAEYFEKTFPTQFMGEIQSDDQRLDEPFGDRSLIGVWKSNQEARAFLDGILPRFDLPTKEAGSAILIHEAELLFDLLFRKHYFPLVKKRGPIIGLRVLWDDILMPALIDFADRYDEYNPPVSRSAHNLGQTGIDRPRTFSSVIREVLQPDVKRRFNAILRAHRRGNPLKEAAATFSGGRSDKSPQEVEAYDSIIAALAPRTREFWEAYVRLRAEVAKRNPCEKRIQNLIYAAVADELGSSSANHARNKFYEVRRRLEAAGLMKPPKPRGRAARKKGQT